MNPAQTPAVQDRYPDDVAHCFGCGRLNAAGHQIKSHPDGEETVARFTPRPEHTSLPGFVYGGLIASLIDCHAMATAAAASERAAGPATGESHAPRFVTASLRVDYRKPTPLGPELELRGRVIRIDERKVTVEVSLSAEGVETVRGEVIAVRMPEHMVPAPRA